MNEEVLKTKKQIRTIPDKDGGSFENELSKEQSSFETVHMVE